VLVAAAALGAAACSTPRDPILVDEGTITVENLTDVEWRNIKIVVNYHFAGGVPRLEAGGRVNAPLSRFQTAFGQQFDRGRQSVFRVDVTATDVHGKPVTLRWGTDQQ
jgi:hypothetical protein